VLNVNSKYLTMEALERIGDFRIGGQLIRTGNYLYDLVILVKAEKVLWDTTDTLIEI
jgi:hypothetical protein